MDWRKTGPRGELWPPRLMAAAEREEVAYSEIRKDCGFQQNLLGHTYQKGDSILSCLKQSTYPSSGFVCSSLALHARGSVWLARIGTCCWATASGWPKSCTELRTGKRSPPFLGSSVGRLRVLGRGWDVPGFLEGRASCTCSSLGSAGLLCRVSTCVLLIQQAAGIRPWQLVWLSSQLPSSFEASQIWEVVACCLHSFRLREGGGCCSLVPPQSTEDVSQAWSVLCLGSTRMGFGYWCVGGIVFSRCCHCGRLNSKRSS